MLKKSAAAVLAVSMVIGIAGCDIFGVRKEMGAVDGVIKEYAKALQTLDEEKILDLTVFDESDSGYDEIKDCFVFDGNAEYIMDVYEATASTIALNANSNSIRIDGDKASIAFDYSIVNWKPLFEGSSESSADLVKAIKNSNDLKSVKGGLEFKKVDGEWKISEIKYLAELLSFTEVWPNLQNKEWPTMPTEDTEPTDEPTFPTGTQFADSYGKAINAYLELLEKNKTAIKEVEEQYHYNPVGVFDINEDGLPELLFLASDGVEPAYMSTLYVYTYNEFAGEAVKVIEVPNIIYMAADGGYFLLYKTPDRIIVTHAGGELVKFQYWTEIYNYNWNLIDSYRRVILTELTETEEIETFEYYEADHAITEEQYNKVFKEDLANTVVILAKNYTPEPYDVEYPLAGKPAYEFMGYETAYAYVKSLQP